MLALLFRHSANAKEHYTSRLNDVDYMLWQGTLDHIAASGLIGEYLSPKMQSHIDSGYRDARSFTNPLGNHPNDAFSNSLIHYER